MKENEIVKNEIEIDTTKKYQKINIEYRTENETLTDYEVYVSKKKDTFWNQWKYYKKGIIDSYKSKFYNLKIEGNENDSILEGTISFFSPSDSIRDSKISPRDVTFVYLQKEDDSVIVKEIRSKSNIIHFDYKDFENLSFVGYIYDLRFIKTDSLSEKLLVNRTQFAIDSKVSTDNYFVGLLK